MIRQKHHTPAGVHINDFQILCYYQVNHMHVTLSWHRDHLNGFIPQIYTKDEGNMRHFIYYIIIVCHISKTNHTKISIYYYTTVPRPAYIAMIRRRTPFKSWWCHPMETFSALLAFCAGNSPVTGEFPTQRPGTRSFGVFFDLRLNKRLSKQSSGWWFGTPTRSLWRHCHV